jgi:hypothetical protein
MDWIAGNRFVMENTNVSLSVIFNKDISMIKTWQKKTLKTCEISLLKITDNDTLVFSITNLLPAIQSISFIYE